MKEDDLYQKPLGNMVFSVYMRRRHKHDIALLAKKQRCPCPEKIHLGVSSPASPKKMIFILENMVLLLKYHIDWHARKDLIRSHRRYSTRKGVLSNFAKFLSSLFLQSTPGWLLLEFQLFSVFLWRPLQTFYWPLLTFIYVAFQWKKSRKRM